MADFFAAYLYIVNKQAVYITQAHILLAGLAATFWIVSKISSASTDHTEIYNGAPNQEQTISLSPEIARGKTLFQSKCASCHSVFKDMTGPALGGFEQRGPWSDRSQLYKWIRNPEGFMKDNDYTKGLKAKYNTVMTAFPGITNEEVDAVLNYIEMQYGQNAVMP